MQDAAFMVTVSNFAPDTPQLNKNPVFLYLSDHFQKPNPFSPNVVVGIDEVVEQKAEALWTLESQIESFWSAQNFETVVPVPTEPAKRKAKKREFSQAFGRRTLATANRFREKLIELYGEERGRRIQHAEAFEICEYGRQPSSSELRQLFPFFDTQQ